MPVRTAQLYLASPKSYQVTWYHYLVSYHIQQYHAAAAQSKQQSITTRPSNAALILCYRCRCCCCAAGFLGMVKTRAINNQQSTTVQVRFFLVPSIGSIGAHRTHTRAFRCFDPLHQQRNRRPCCCCSCCAFRSDTPTPANDRHITINKSQVYKHACVVYRYSSVLQC